MAVLVQFLMVTQFFFFFSSRRRHTRFDCDWSSDVCSSDLGTGEGEDSAEEVAADTKGKPTTVTRPSELLDAVLAAGRKGLSIQRYKGLGEMNAEQLWETTLDPANRSLLRVEVAQADVADEIFTRLMGDVVEPRREFI